MLPSRFSAGMIDGALHVVSVDSSGTIRFIPMGPAPASPILTSDCTLVDRLAPSTFDTFQLLSGCHQRSASSSKSAKVPPPALV